MRISRHFIVSGRVQGVGFRAATQEIARRLELAGWVRNRVDGTVEVTAGGSDEALDRLHDWLYHGPTAAHVSDIVSTDREANSDLPTPFDVR